jgi:hypothetical protein
VSCGTENSSKDAGCTKNGVKALSKESDDNYCLVTKILNSPSKKKTHSIIIMRLSIVCPLAGWARKGGAIGEDLTFQKV